LSDGYQIPYDWKHGELPPVEDIRAWLELAKVGNDSFYGPRIEIPEPFYFRLGYVSDLKYQLDLHGKKWFSDLYKTEDVWEAAKKDWIDTLKNDEHLRHSLAKKGLRSELGLDGFEKPIIISSSPPILGSSEFSDQSSAYPFTSQLERQPNAAPGGFKKKLDELNRVQLPGSTETVSMGTGTSCGIIGKGGMGVVYKTYLERLELYRAVKILLFHQTCENEEQFNNLTRRSETEARIWAKLSNSNIVQVHHFGDWQGLPYLEMELVEGSDLKKLVLKRGALPLEACTAIGILAVKGLRFAHKQKGVIFGNTYDGLIHRDIKPQNILCSETGEIKLADFGLAKPSLSVVNTTLTNSFVGSPQYAAPEQIESGNVDSRSDIYSLGATLYEILSGKEMFPQGSPFQVFAARQRNKFIPLAKTRHIPKDLIWIVEKCTNLNPNDRFGEATALLEALEDCHRKLTREIPEAVLEDFVIGKQLLKGKGPVESKAGKEKGRFWFSR